jgi:hypothetical protein
MPGLDASSYIGRTILKTRERPVKLTRLGSWSRALLALSVAAVVAGCGGEFDAQVGSFY